MTPFDALESLRAAAVSGPASSVRQKLAWSPAELDAWRVLAGREVAAGRGVGALRVVERLLAIEPHSATARLGAIAIAQSIKAATPLQRHLARALARDDDPLLRLIRAEHLMAYGRHREAEDDFRLILRREPGQLAASVNLGAILNASGRAREGEILLRRAVALDPASSPALQNLTFARMVSGSPTMTLAAAAASVDPLSTACQINLAATADALDRPDVERFLRRALALAPNALPALQMLGRRDSRAFRWQTFEAWTRRALCLSPGDPDLALALAQGHLIRGDTARGWIFWEGRLLRPELQRHDLQGHRWKGQPLHGDTIVLHAEQGFGETIQFLRFAHDVAARGGRTIVEVQPELATLCARGLGDAKVIRRGDPLPPHAWHCPLPSLPAVLGVGLEAPPTRMPYLVAKPEGVAQWRQQLRPAMGPLIGICWRGNPAFPDDRRRSPGLHALTSMLDADATFVSLTKAPSADDVPFLPRLYDPTFDLGDFDATAALIDALDLVITSDTAIAHLSGALAKPTWLLLAHAADWRWLMGVADSPWYPSMRLFRQHRPGDWAQVAADVVQALADFSAALTR